MVSKLTNLLSCDKSPEFFNQKQIFTWQLRYQITEWFRTELSPSIWKRDCLPLSRPFFDKPARSFSEVTTQIWRENEIFKFANNLLHWRIDCFGLEPTMNAKRGVKGLKIALFTLYSIIQLRWLATKSKRKCLWLDHWLCTFYHVTIRDARSYDYDITKVNRMTWRTC